MWIKNGPSHIPPTKNSRAAQNTTRDFKKQWVLHAAEESLQKVGCSDVHEISVTQFILVLQLMRTFV